MLLDIAFKICHGWFAMKKHASANKFFSFLPTTNNLAEFQNQVVEKTESSPCEFSKLGQVKLHLFSSKNWCCYTQTFCKYLVMQS